jgi:hypothetical protein
MKYLIIPAKELQAGDVLFTSSQEHVVNFCGRVVGMNAPVRGARTLEFRVESLVDTEAKQTVLEFSLGHLVGVARDDAYVDVDVASILADMDDLRPGK